MFPTSKYWVIIIVKCKFFFSCLFFWSNSKIFQKKVLFEFPRQQILLIKVIRIRPHSFFWKEIQNENVVGNFHYIQLNSNAWKALRFTKILKARVYQIFRSWASLRKGSLEAAFFLSVSKGLFLVYTVYIVRIGIFQWSLCH